MRRFAKRGCLPFAATRDEESSRACKLPYVSTRPPTLARDPNGSRLKTERGYSLMRQALRRRGANGERGEWLIKRSAAAELPAAPIWQLAMARKPSRS